MEERVRKYISQLGTIGAGQINNYIDRFRRNADIMEEFSNWIENNSFPTDENAIVVNEYTAKKIKEIAPALSGLGVYNFLIDLREKPEEARQVIEDGFIIR